MTFTIDGGTATQSDQVRLREAPLLTSHHLSPAETTYVTQLNTASSQATRADLLSATLAAGEESKLAQLSSQGSRVKARVGAEGGCSSSRAGKQALPVGSRTKHGPGATDRASPDVAWRGYV